MDVPRRRSCTRSEDLDSPPTPTFTAQRMDTDDVVEITEEAEDPIVTDPPLSLQRAAEQATRHSSRSSRKPERFAPETNFNDTAIRAARAAEPNPLYEPSSADTVARIPADTVDDERHVALHLRTAKRPRVLQHSGVARELTAWRESMTIKEAKYKTRHFNPHSYSFATFASGGCLDSLGAIKVGLNPLWGCEINLTQQEMWSAQSSEMRERRTTRSSRSLPLDRQGSGV